MTKNTIVHVVTKQQQLVPKIWARALVQASTVYAVLGGQTQPDAQNCSSGPSWDGNDFCSCTSENNYQCPTGYWCTSNTALAEKGVCVPGEAGEGAVVYPRRGSQHTHTIILLHGISTDGWKFWGPGGNSLESVQSELSNLKVSEKAKGIKWIFPTVWFFDYSWYIYSTSCDNCPADTSLPSDLQAQKCPSAQCTNAHRDADHDDMNPQQFDNSTRWLIRLAEAEAQALDPTNPADAMRRIMIGGHSQGGTVAINTAVYPWTWRAPAAMYCLHTVPMWYTINGYKSITDGQGNILPGFPSQGYSQDANFPSGADNDQAKANMGAMTIYVSIDQWDIYYPKELQQKNYDAFKAMGWDVQPADSDSRVAQKVQHQVFDPTVEVPKFASYIQHAFGWLEEDGLLQMLNVI